MVMKAQKNGHLYHLKPSNVVEISFWLIECAFMTLGKKQGLNRL